MNEKLLQATVEYLKNKKNKDQQDLANERRAWSELVKLGVKKEEDIPKYLEEAKVEEAKVEEAEEAKIEEAKVEEAKVEEAKVEEVKVDDPKPAGKKKNTTPKAATPE